MAKIIKTVMSAISNAWAKLFGKKPKQPAPQPAPKPVPPPAPAPNIQKGAGTLTQTTATADNWLALVLNATPIANIADNAASSPLTNIYVSLHTAFPGLAGNQTSNEAAYGSYARVAAARTSGGWTVASGQAVPTSPVTFPTATSGSETETYVGIGSSASGAGNLYWFSTISPITVTTGVTPQITAPGAGPPPPPPPPPPGGIVLTRTITNLGGSSLPATAFWTFGHPFKPGEVPFGSIVTADLNGTNIPISAIAQKYHADGSLAWAQILADFSGISLASGASQTFTFTPVTGSWSPTTNRTNSDWSGLVDTVELTNLSTTSTSHPDMDGAGTWVAAFDAGGTNTIETYGSGARGLWVSVKAQIKNGSTVHAYLVARMEYWVCQKADGTLGPIASRGPFIENVQLFKLNAESVNNPGQFTYDLNWKRNGVSQRTQLAIPHIAGTLAQMCRYDGQWDWNGTDPQIGVTQDYTLSRKTLKIPPFISGISYTGAGNCVPNVSISGINTSTGVFTVSNTNNFFGVYHFPVAVGFTASSMPSGLSADPHVYWASYIDGTTFAIYDTFAHASAGGSTGKVIPSTSGTSVVLRLSIAPLTPGAYDQVTGDAGSRNDLSLLTEWGSAYHVGNTADFQRLARVMAYAYASMPQNVLNDATGKIPCFISPATSGLGTAKTTTWWFGGAGASSSSDIGGGTFATGSANNWSLTSDHPTGAVHYAVWVMEGGTILRDIIIYEGNMVLATVAYGPRRALVIGGTTYYGSAFFNYSGEGTRTGAWALRDVSYAAFAAGNGSPEEAYFRQVMTNNCAQWAAYQAYKGGHFSDLGLIVYDEVDYPPASNNVGNFVTEGFMQSYMGLTTAIAAMMHGDYVSGLNTVATYASRWLVGLYNSSFPSYFATSYTLTSGLGDYNTAGPGTYVSSLAELGLGNGSNMTFSFNGTQTITVGGSGFPWALANGDKYRPQNYFNADTAPPRNAAPSPFVDGTDYTLTGVNAVAGTFTTATTAGSSVSNVGGWFLPTGQSNPGSGTISGSTSFGDDYLPYQFAALAAQAVFGAANASTAYTNAMSRFTGGLGAFSTQCMWAFQATL